MKKMLATLAAAAAVTAPVIAASPAHADSKFAYADCTVAPGATNAYGNIKVEGPSANGAHFLTGKINDPMNREWHWKFKHDGTFSFGGTAWGDSVIQRDAADTTGPDTYEFRFTNAAGTVTCSAVVTI